MDFRKTILYFALAVLGVMLWHTWQHDYSLPAQMAADSPADIAAARHPAEFAPIANGQQAPSYQVNAKTLATALPADKVITVKTDVISAKINLRGGDLVDAKLLQYPVSIADKNNAIQILNPSNDALYIAQSGLSVPSNEQKTSTPIMYTSAETSYVLKPGDKSLVVTLKGENGAGLTVVKTFTFKPNDYAVQTGMQLTNTASQPWQGNVYNQITRRFVPLTNAFSSRSYDGPAVSTENTPYKKLPYATLNESNFSRDIQNGWIAMQQHYFLSAWVAPKNQTLHYYSRSFGQGEDGKNNIFVLGYMSAPIQLAPNTSTSFNSVLYVGPEIAKNLAPIAKGLNLTVDYGWLWPISKFLFWLMSEIHRFVGNWGWSIILVTIAIKLAFYGLSNKSYASMAKTRELQPKIKALQERYGDDKQAMSKAMMEMYRKEKINPLGGCLPMVVQIPVFIALYYVLIESVELRQAPFIFWIHDLSMKDPYFILPILMGLSMLLQQKISPPPPDPAQAKMMMMLPIVFTVFFATFPAGLVLYWLTNNCASILQQWYVMKSHKKLTKIKAKK